ncbi:MAG: VWA domain-containing protein [Bradymonadaceae bacterium]|nr:VWA domain-containing protein [Lujinxingiaceae bacterium]
MILTRRQLFDSLFWIVLAAAWMALGFLYFQRIIEPGVETIAFEYGERSVEILAPRFFGLALVLPLLWVIARFTLSDLPRYQRWINIVFRAAIIVAIVGALVQVVFTSFESRVSTIFLVDTSASVPDEVLEQATAYINEAIEAKGERDEVRVVAFARRPYVLELGDEGKLDTIARPAVEDDTLYTDIAAGMRMVYGLFPQDHLKRVVVVSDGNETRGDFLAEAYRASAFGIRIYNKEIEFEAKPEVLIQDLDVPESIELGAPFNLVARVFSTHKERATITLWQNEFKDGTQTVDLEPGLNEVSFKTQVYEPGFREFRLEMKVEGQDTFEANNRFVHSMNVRGKPRILYIEGEQRARVYLERALKGENFEVETRGPTGMPRTAKELEAFDLVLLSDAPASSMSHDQMQLFERYVREGGGGFIMAGGEASFGSGGYEGTEIEKILPVRFEPEKKRDTPSLALLLVIDRSGSMVGERMELAKDAAKAAVEALKPQDQVGIIVFDHAVDTIARLQPASNRSRILTQISRVDVRGGTDIAIALAEAYEQLAFASAKIKHVILLSDGESPPKNMFTEILPAMRIENITVSTVAVGDGSDTSMLRRIAERGNGRYYFTNNPYHVPQIFVQETNTVARSSMVEEPFRPKVVGRAQVLDGIPWAQAPFLLGYVSTKAKPQADVLLVSDHGEPILARWRHGLGKTVAFTSDLKNRWAVEWVRWPGYAKFWSQLIRDTMRTDDRNNLPMRIAIVQDHAHITVDAIGEDDGFINHLQSKVQMTSPSGKTDSIELQQTAAGRYEARVPLQEFGSYSFKAGHDKDGDTIAVSQGSVAYPYPQEFMFVEPNYALLRRAAEIGSGTTNPAVQTLFEPTGEQVKYRRHIWPYFVVIALMLLIFDLALRRIRLSGKTEIRWESILGGR